MIDDQLPLGNIQSLTMARIFVVVSQNNFNVSHGTKTLFQWRQPTYLCYFLSTCDDPFSSFIIGFHLSLIADFSHNHKHWSSWWHDWSLKQPSHFFFFFFFFFLLMNGLSSWRNMISAPWFLHIEVHHSHGTWFSTC